MIVIMCNVFMSSGIATGYQSLILVTGYYTHQYVRTFLVSFSSD